VNERFVRTFFGEDDALGRTVTLHRAAQGRERFGEPFSATIVGIAGDERFFGPEQQTAPAAYVPYTWDVWGSIFVVARAGTADPRSVIPAMRAALLAIDPELPIAGPGVQTQLRPITDYVASQTEARRLNAGVLAGFGAAALLLALIGIVGVVAYLVAQRTRELGVRLALGATPADVLGLVLGHALRLAAAGVAAGTLAALAATRMLRAELYEVSAADPAVYAAVGVLFALAAALGSLAPALRAAKVDPTRSLRMD
jgi:putative ABC transport system permease protein